MKRIAEKIGEALVNFSVRHLGVKPYNTDLLQLPGDIPPIHHYRVDPVILESFVDFDVRNQPDEEWLMNYVCRNLAKSKEFTSCFIEKVEELDPVTRRYFVRIAVLPSTFLQ